MTADTDFAIVPFVSIVPIVSKKIFNFGPSAFQPPTKKIERHKCRSIFRYVKTLVKVLELLSIVDLTYC